MKQLSYRNQSNAEAFFVRCLREIHELLGSAQWFSTMPALFFVYLSLLVVLKSKYYSLSKISQVSFQMPSSENLNPARTTNIRNELTRLREQLQDLRQHLRVTAEFTEGQETFLIKIRAKLHTFNSTATDFHQTQSFDK
jgi:hypothetical protein